jgi:hypothetical protein
VFVQVRLKTVQSLISVCQHAEHSVSTPLIHGVATQILEHVVNCAENDDSKPTNELEFVLLTECVKLAEALVTQAESQTSEFYFICLMLVVLPIACVVSAIIWSLLKSFVSVSREFDRL